MKNSIGLMCLLLVGRVASCYCQNQPQFDAFVQTSLDVAKNVLSGPSYEKSKLNTIDVFAVNAAIAVNVPYKVDLMFDNYRDDSDFGANYRDPHLTTLPASSKSGLEYMTVPDKLSFLEHTSLMAAIQLIGKGGKKRLIYYL